MKEFNGWGGRRAGAGRPKGSIKNTGRDFYFSRAITKEEKEYLGECLKQFRAKMKS